MMSLPARQAGPTSTRTETRERVVAALIGAIERSPLFGRISTDKLASQITERFDRYLDGRRFTLEPVVGSILRAKLGTAEDCAFVVEFMKAAVNDLVFQAPELEIHEQRLTRIAKEARRAATAWAKGGRPDRMQLGRILVENRIVNAAQLERALEHQRSFGGRLGTHLVKLGYVGAPALAHYLGIQLNQPAADLQQIKRIDEQALRIVPAELIREHHVFPLSLKNGTLRVAMVDPTDRETLDVLAYRTGCRVLALVAPEALIDALIERHVAAARSRPLSIVPSIEEEAFEVVHTSQRKEQPPKAPLTVVPEERPALTPPPKSSTGPKLQIENRGDFMQSERPDLAVQSHSAGRLHADLLEAESLEDVLAAAARYLGLWLGRVAGFELTDGVAHGRVQCGCTLSQEGLRQVQVSLDRSAAMRSVVREQLPVTKAPTESVLDQALATKLGIPSDSPILVVPVLQEDRVVALLYAGAPKQVGALPDPETLRGLAQKCGLATELVQLKGRILAS